MAPPTVRPCPPRQSGPARPRPTCTLAVRVQRRIHGRKAARARGSNLSRSTICNAVSSKPDAVTTASHLVATASTPRGRAASFTGAASRHGFVGRPDRHRARAALRRRRHVLGASGSPASDQRSARELGALGRWRAVVRAGDRHAPQRQLRRHRGHAEWAWLLGRPPSDGGVFTFGDAPFHGSVGGRALAAPIVGIAATPSGNGYWLVGSDGGVFAFGDAGFHGSIASPAPRCRRSSPSRSTPSGNGYWIVGNDGGVFSFGDAAFEGAATSFDHHAPLVGMAPTALRLRLRPVRRRRWRVRVR